MGFTWAETGLIKAASRGRRENHESSREQGHRRMPESPVLRDSIDHKSSPQTGSNNSNAETSSNTPALSEKNRHSQTQSAPKGCDIIAGHPNKHSVSGIDSLSSSTCRAAPDYQGLSPWRGTPAKPASLTVISVKAVSGMITFSVMDKMQLTYPIFYIMFIIMVASCVFQVKFLNQATKLYNTTMVVPVNHIFFTTSAIIAGIIFYQEFLGAAFLTIFIYLFGCLLSFLGVLLVTRNREKEHMPRSYIDFGNIPGKQMLDKIQPDSNGLSCGTLPDGSDSTKSQSGEKKED